MQNGQIVERFMRLREIELPRVMRLIDEVLQQSTPAGSGLVEMCHYHLETGGKRLRALLPLMVAESLGAEPGCVLPFGAACEMLHNATLVHDDLQDGDRQRRGRDTIWERYGASRAINLGDAMFYYALLLLQRLDVPVEARERAASRLLHDTLRVIDGQEREFLLKGQKAPSLEGYFAMVEGKTSGLFALPLAGAAELCGAEETVVEALAESSRHLGVLFQIQDDVLDLYGDKGRASRGSDVGEGKRSVLVVHALNHGSAEDACWLRGVLDRDRAETCSGDISEACALFERLGSLDFALSEVSRRRQAALEPTIYRTQETISSLVDGLCDLFLAPIAPLMAERLGGKSSSGGESRIILRVASRIRESSSE
ncbi:MAG: polyprenyl synthetase family protein [Deltaproteobacteria bacterium]|nr:polyprenyl synthetase family protein [Deltaproteobacteria bacterium]